MKKLLSIVLPLAVLSTACVPMYAMRAVPRYPAGPGLYARAATAPLPVGRWDNVMLLAEGTPVQVLMMGGGRAAGDVLSASSTSLRLRTASGTADLPAADVMRVDTLDDFAGGQMLRHVRKGAAVGAGAVGVMGLIAGHVPPPRLFLAGAIAGGYQGSQMAESSRGMTIVYLAAFPVAPTNSGTQLSAREVPR